MKITIDRSRWLRGEGNEESKLLRKSDGKMCCLGFRAIAAGVREDVIEGLATPIMIIKADHDWWADLDWLVMQDDRGNQKHSLECLRAMEINDNIGLPEDRREASLIEIFARNGDELEFVG